MATSNQQDSYTTPEGYRNYKRSIAFILAAAAQRLNLGNLAVEESIGASFVFIVKNSETSTETANGLQEAMKALVFEDIAIVSEEVPRAELVAYFTKLGADRSLAFVSAQPSTHMQCNCLALGNSEMKYIGIAHHKLVRSTGAIDPQHFLVSAETKPFPHYRLYHALIADNQLVLDPTVDQRDESTLLQAYATRKEWGRKLHLNSVVRLNKQITDSKIKQMIQYSEGVHDHQVVAITNRIAGVNADGTSTGAPAPRLILIAGPSSSGKTTFAKRLCVSLETAGLHPIVISVDSYYKGWPDIDGRGMQYVDWEALQSLHLELLNEHLVDLLAGKEVLVPEYDMRTSMPMSEDHWVKTRLPEGGCIIMEGIHCLNPELTSRIPRSEKFQIMISPLSSIIVDDLTIQSSSQIRMLRRMVRDYLFRGRSASGTLRQWPGVALGERHNIYPNQIYADVVMNSGLAYEANVLKVFAEPLLKTIMPDQAEYNEARRLLAMLDNIVSMPSEGIPPQSLLREFVGGSWFYEYAGMYKTA
jgi:uridine kinase